VGELNNLMIVYRKCKIIHLK